MERALVIGGTGMMRTTAEVLAATGHTVTVTCRDPHRAPASWADLGIEVVAADRGDTPYTDFLAHRADVVVDAQCHGPEEAAQLVRWSRHALVVMISSAAVYVDAHGNHQNSDARPSWRGSITEDTPTMPYRGEPWDSRLGYGAAKAEAERILLSDGSSPLVLRPAKVHGPGMRNARELAVVEPLVREGRLVVRDLPTHESTTSAGDIAAVVRAHLLAPTARVVNVADADAPSPLERARQLAAQLPGAPTVEVIPADAPGDDGLLPWPADRVLDTTRQEALGVMPRPYAESVRPAVEWLLDQASPAAAGRH